MHRFLPTLSLVLVLVACATIARADAPATPVPDPKPDLSSMSFLVGTWKCHSSARGSARTSTTTYTMDYDGRWLKAHDVAPVFDKFRTRPIVADTWLTYNPDNKMWVNTTVDNFGGYGIAMSPGWDGNKLTSTVAMSNDGSTGIDVLTKTSDTEITDTFTAKDKAGKASAPHTTICKKD
jgi:hypothetical protein